MTAGGMQDPTTDLPEGVSASSELTLDELQLSQRNHGMHLEGLRYDVTPAGMHYLLIHFDVPEGDAATWSLSIDGLVSNPMSVSLNELRGRPTVTMPVTMECAGNGRARLVPRPISQPWLGEAVGTAEWTGTPLRPLVEEAGPLDEAVEFVFAGADRGVQKEIEHDYERSLPIADAMRDEVLLAYEMNGAPLPPQHGYPLRLVVPGWYGMTSVKWLTRITAVSEPFEGFQQLAYRYRQQPEEDGDARDADGAPLAHDPAGHPGLPDAEPHRRRRAHVLRGRAWSGWGPIERVEVSADGGSTWKTAELGDAVSPHAWRSWSFDWDAQPGTVELCCRAADGAGNEQPLEPSWNLGGFSNNAVQRVSVEVRPRT